MYGLFEQEEDHRATPTEAVQEWAYNYGADRPERPWILSDWDTWERNPHYCGPAVPHPEFDNGDAYAPISHGATETLEPAPVCPVEPTTPEDEIPF